MVAKPGIALRRAAQASKWGQCPISNPPSDHEYHAAPQPVSAIVQPVDRFDDRQVSSSAAAAAEVLDAYQAQPKPSRRIAVFESYDPLAVINRHIGLMKRQWPPSLIVAIPSRPPERNNLIVPKAPGLQWHPESIAQNQTNDSSTRLWPGVTRPSATRGTRLPFCVGTRRKAGHERKRRD